MFKRWHLYLCTYIADQGDSKVTANFPMVKKGPLSCWKDIHETTQTREERYGYTNTVLTGAFLLTRTWRKPEVD